MMIFFLLVIFLAWQPFGPPDKICGPEVVHGMGGVITSPHFPAPFPGNIQCTWLIKVESKYKILLNFVFLDIKNTGKTFIYTFNDD